MTIIRREILVRKQEKIASAYSEEVGVYLTGTFPSGVSPPTHNQNQALRAPSMRKKRNETKA